MVDVYVHGRTEACQEDCYKFVEQSRVSVPGGAANAARSLENWNAICECFGNTVDNGPIKTRFVVNGKVVFRHDIDKMDMDDRRRAVEVATLFGWKPDAILISDYDKGFLARAFIRQIIDLAHERGIPVVADAKREPELYRGAVLKCNKAYAEVHSHSIAGLGAIITRGEQCPLKTSTSMPYMDDGSVGCWMIGHHNTPVPCVNHVGAGDCFAAYLTLALAHGRTLEESASFAHSAGRVYVQYPHNRPPLPAEVMADLRD